MKKILMLAQQWMQEYIDSFRCDDEDVMFGIQLKALHTGYVRDNARALAKHLQLPEQEALLAELMGLLHDVGRFRQWQLYQTFVDAKSEDHAELGIKTIAELPFFAQIPKEAQEILLFAIQNHNKKTIATHDNAKFILFAKIIRDADKLDIFRVLEPYLTDDNIIQKSATIQRFIKGPNGSANFEDIISPDFLTCFVEGQQVDYTQIRTNGDRKLVRLMWIYDVNFAWTLLRIRERGYIDKIIEHLPEEPQVALGVRRLQEYVIKKCNTADLPLNL